ARCSQRGPATAFSSGFRFHHGPLEAPVHRIDEQPRPPVRHAELARGTGDGTVSRDRFQQIDLAWTDGDVVAEADAKPELDASPGSPLRNRAQWTDSQSTR